MTEDDAKRAAMDGDWEAVARFVVRKGLASPQTIMTVGGVKDLAAEVARRLPTMTEGVLLQALDRARSARMRAMSHSADAILHLVDAPWISPTSPRAFGLRPLAEDFDE